MEAVTVDLVAMLSRVIRTSIPLGSFIYGEFSMQRKTTGKGKLGELQNEIQTEMLVLGQRFTSLVFRLLFCSCQRCTHTRIRLYALEGISQLLIEAIRRRRPQNHCHL